MPDATYKRHDTFPPLQAQLLSAGSPIDLTNATSVKVILKGNSVVVSGLCTIMTPETDGNVQYSWAPTDLAQSDIYEVEFEIRWATGGKETVPNASYNSLLVMDDLDNN